jgi:DUF971 family protein
MRPKQITADRRKRMLYIGWDDGHESHYRFSGLRAVCPCVECKGGHAQMGLPPEPRVVRDTPLVDLNLEQVVAVGSYAIQFYWDDGHSTGIYTWELLRAACPCENCLPKTPAGAE